MNARDTVRPTDTIISLAVRLLGDPMKWRELVTLNGLRPPYLTPDGTGGTLKPGDTILYPATPGAVPPRSAALLDVETYRRDLAITRRGDLVLQGGDLKTHAGLDNLHAALLTRVRVALGSHPFHPAYGSRLKTHLGRPADEARINLAVDDVLRAVMRDPRVQSASGQAVYQSDELMLALTVTPIPPGTPFQLNVPWA